MERKTGRCALRACSPPAAINSHSRDVACYVSRSLPILVRIYGNTAGLRVSEARLAQRARGRQFAARVLPKTRLSQSPPKPIF